MQLHFIARIPHSHYKWRPSSFFFFFSRFKAVDLCHWCDSSLHPMSSLTSCTGNSHLRRRHCPWSLLFCRFLSLSCCDSPTVRPISPGHSYCLFACRPPGRPALWPSYFFSTSFVCSGTRFWPGEKIIVFFSLFDLITRCERRMCILQGPIMALLCVKFA